MAHTQLLPAGNNDETYGALRRRISPDVFLRTSESAAIWHPIAEEMWCARDGAGHCGRNHCHPHRNVESTRRARRPLGHERRADLVVVVVVVINCHVKLDLSIDTIEHSSFFFVVRSETEGGVDEPHPSV
jgi:hypothetical protein